MGWRVAYVGLAVVLVVIAVPSVFLFVREPENSPMVRARRAASGAAVLPGSFGSRGAFVAQFLVVGGRNYFGCNGRQRKLGSRCFIVDRPGLVPRGGRWDHGLGGLGKPGRTRDCRLDAGQSVRTLCSYAFIHSSPSRSLSARFGNESYSWGCRNWDNHWSRNRYHWLHDFAVFWFAKIWSALWVFVRRFLIGTGIGPAVMGAVQTRLHSYDSAFYAFGIMLALAIFFMLFLGRYAYPVGEGEDLVDVAHSQLSDA